MPKKLSQAQAIARFRGAHGDTYDYRLVSYRSTDDKVTVVCRTHGPFQILPQHHWQGVGCRDCYAVRMRLGRSEFIRRSQRAHTEVRFDYSRIGDSVGTGDRIQLRCMSHDQWFTQVAKSHIRGHDGCQTCISEKALGARRQDSTPNRKATPTETFVERARSVHGDKYSYSTATYRGVAKRVEIGCPTHGAFQQTAQNHLKGNGCPRCAIASRTEGTLKAACKAAGIDYARSLKRRQAGMTEAQVFKPDYLRGERVIGPIMVKDILYPNLESAARALNPLASTQTIARWIAKGCSPDEAFDRIPNPGFANGIIYLITHRASSKRYVGQTIVALDKRWRAHCEQAAKHRIRHDGSLHAAIRTHGPDAFTIEQIDSGTTKSGLESKERHWIRRLGTHWPDGYNLTPGGESGGSFGRAVEVDGIWFNSVRRAAEHIASTRAISLDAAKARIRMGRIDVTTPPKPGQGLCRTRAYKAWSAIVHGLVSPASKRFDPGIELHPPWRDFKQFLADVGQPTSQDLVFARLDKTRGFTPDNCRWISRSAAARLSAASGARRKKAASLADVRSPASQPPGASNSDAEGE